MATSSVSPSTASHPNGNGSSCHASPAAPTVTPAGNGAAVTASGGGGRKWTFQILPKPGELESQFEDLMADEEAVEVDETVPLDDRTLPLAYQSARHTEVITGNSDGEAQTWRSRERMKTVSVALVICLNVGVDPPDVIKTQPCAKVECWIDPHTLNGPRAVEMVGANLQRQYERWQSRARQVVLRRVSQIL